MPVDQTGASLLMETEEVKILAKLPVVPPLDIGQVIKIKPQLLGIRPGGAVDAGEHRVLLVATPVCTGYRQELERIGVQLLRRLAMIAFIRALISSRSLSTS